MTFVQPYTIDSVYANSFTLPGKVAATVTFGQGGQIVSIVIPTLGEIVAPGKRDDASAVFMAPYMDEVGGMIVYVYSASITDTDFNLHQGGCYAFGPWTGSWETAAGGGPVFHPIEELWGDESLFHVKLRLLRSKRSNKRYDATLTSDSHALIDSSGESMVKTWVVTEGLTFDPLQINQPWTIFKASLFDTMTDSAGSRTISDFVFGSTDYLGSLATVEDWCELTHSSLHNFKVRLDWKAIAAGNLRMGTISDSERDGFVLTPIMQSLTAGVRTYSHWYSITISDTTP